ncbi:MAG: GYD domain-containing protein [Acidobacteria bacterium]|nr:GYD domain-containing protein [Acidobacteriota bacterium]
MPKYLLQASYTAEGLRGLLKEGATKRKAAVEQLIDSLGGKLEVFYPAFGDTDVFLIVDAPDNETAAAASMVVGASGAVQVRTTVLLTPEEMDRATKKSVSYRPPGK